MRNIALLISIIIFSCHSPIQKKETSNVDSLKVIDTTLQNENFKESYTTEDDTTTTYNYQNSPFKFIKQFPIISDTIAFIHELKNNCHLFPRSTLNQTINYFKKVKLYGSTKEFYFIEYDFKGSSNSLYPWKNQLLFDKSGKVIKILSAKRIDLIKIFPNQNPFLITVSSTGKGNGWHEILRINKDTIENVYDAFLGNRPQTYDAYEDQSVNMPNEFHYKIVDINNDGFNDIKFYGNIFLIQGVTKDGLWYDSETSDGETITYSVNNPYKKIPVSFYFLYNPKSGHFVEQEDYSKKYEYIFGNTK